MMRGKLLGLGAIILLASLAGGCAYTQDRVLDLVDVAGAKVIAGPWGVKGALGVGPYRAPVSIGIYDFHKYGFEGRAIGKWAEEGGDIVVPVEYSVDAEWGNRYLYENIGEFHALRYVAQNAEFDTVGYTELAEAHHYRNWGDFQATAYLAFVGLEANLSAGQLADFVLGIFTIDIYQDDHDSREEAGWKDPEQSMFSEWFTFRDDEEEKDEEDQLADLVD